MLQACLNPPVAGLQLATEASVMFKVGLLHTRVVLIFALPLAYSSTLVPVQTGSQLPATRPERTGYFETSRYEDVLEFLHAADAASPRIHLTSFGYSYEGRSLPLVVVGTVRDGRPESVLASGRTRVYIQADIHAGEVDGKEAMLALLRSIAAGEHSSWLESMVLLIAPIYNADGNERINLENRPGQNGPIGVMGQRANAQGYDLNRDYVKLEAPETRSVVALLNRYDPHVALDLHTTNGTHHAYYLTYEPPLHPGAAREIAGLLRDALLPAVTREIKGRYGWDLYYYGNVPGRQWRAERGWYASDHLARYGHNYIGLRNRFCILSESYAYLSFEERVRASQHFTEEVLNYVQLHADEIRQATADADQQSVVGEELALRAAYAKSLAAAEILMGDVTEERNPYTGAIMLRRLDVRKPEVMPVFGKFRAVESARAPRAYFIPAALERALERLQAHGIRSYRLERTTALRAERFRIASSVRAEEAYQGHNERTLTGKWQASDLTLPAGTVAVNVDQPLGRLAFLLLEPRSDDGFVTWNLLDDTLDKTEFYPISRTFEDLPVQR